eukprot:3425934-Amphidinium_carterae.1
MTSNLSGNGTAISSGAVPFVADTRTGEHIYVPNYGGQVYVNSGHAYHVQADGHAVWLSKLQRHLVYIKEGAEFIYSRQVGTAVWLSELPKAVAVTRTLPTTDVTIDVAELRVQTFRCFRRLLPRGGCSILLPLHFLYKQLGFETSKWPGTWTKAGFTRWCRWLTTSMGLSDSHCRENVREADDAIEDHEKKSPCVSACALLALLARWASPSSVGFKSAADRERSRSCLHLLLSWLSDRLGDIHIVCYDMRFDWHPPEVPKGEGRQRKLTLSKGHFMKEHLHPLVVETMCQQTTSALGVQVRAADAFIAMATGQESVLVLKCVVAQLGVLLDCVLWDSCWSGETPELSSVRQVQMSNMKYVQASKRSLAGEQNLSLALDASRVGKRKVMLGVLSGGRGGLTCLMPPQISLVWTDLFASCGVGFADPLAEKRVLADRNTEHELGITTSGELRDAFVERQRRWLGKRKLQAEDAARGGNKKKVARKATLQLMKAVEHMVQQSSGRSLLDFMPTPPSAPSSWPHLAIS